MKKHGQIHTLMNGTFVLHSWGCFSQVPQLSSFHFLGIGSPYDPVKTSPQTDTMAPSSERHTKKQSRIHTLIQTPR